MENPLLIRGAFTQVQELLLDFPVVAILGPRQCGKSTLSKQIIDKIPDALYVDLEDYTELAKLTDPILFFQNNQNKLICLDEIQLKPELFKTIRSTVDKTGRNGQFLILGSASRELIRQSSESLAGRIFYVGLTPFLFLELYRHNNELNSSDYWFNGGFPRSYLARNPKAANQWRQSFIRTYLEQDIPQLGFNIPASILRRLWKILAHHQGQILNTSKLGEVLGVSHTTVRNYLEILTQTFMVRILKPYETNFQKRLVKTPKVYLRDTGILHTLLEISDFNQLMGHISIGASWEGLVIENITNHLSDWTPYFYRTSAGAEMDLVLTKGDRLVAIECKVSLVPILTKGFWNSVDDLKPDETWIIIPADHKYSLKPNVTVAGLRQFLEEMKP